MLGQEVLERSSGDEGVIGAVNVYLVVFREGILSVSFSLFYSLLVLNVSLVSLRRYLRTHGQVASQDHEAREYISHDVW